jgi:GMP synthase (glutamine-hydrolysing)
MSQTEARTVERPAGQSEAAERPLIVLDFGAQYAQLIARRIRELRVFSEILAHDTPVDELRERNPIGIVLSGGPASIHEPGAPVLDPEILELGVPVLGICYGMQAMAQALGGEVGRTGIAEFGKTTLGDVGGVLFEGLGDMASCWMSHNDAVTRVPAGFEATASTPTTAIAAMEAPARGLSSVQFHPEV